MQYIAVINSYTFPTHIYTSFLIIQERDKLVANLITMDSSTTKLVWILHHLVLKLLEQSICDLDV